VGARVLGSWSFHTTAVPPALMFRLSKIKLSLLEIRLTLKSSIVTAIGSSALTEYPCRVLDFGNSSEQVDRRLKRIPGKATNILPCEPGKLLKKSDKIEGFNVPPIPRQTALVRRDSASHGFRCRWMFQPTKEAGCLTCPSCGCTS